jgi:acetylornithine deacetylase
MRRMAELTARECAVLDAVDDLWRGGGPLRELSELVAIPSVTGTDAEHDAQRWMADRLTELDLDVDLWRIDLDILRADPAFPGTEAPRTEAWGLAGTAPGEPGAPTLILAGHLDVVPPGDGDGWPGADPYRVHPTRIDGRDVLVGRGTCDMKAGAIAHLLALRALRTAGGRLAATVAVHSVVGEEDGGLGAFATLARGHHGDACVITEPTGRQVVTANGGALSFRLEVPGRAAHGSARYEGVSAIEAFAGVHRALLELEHERCRDAGPLMAGYEIAYPLSIGTVRAGDWASTVPDLLVAEGRYGVRIDEPVDDARAAFAAAVAEACARDPWLRDHPVRVSWWGGQFASGRLPAGHPLLPLAQHAWADVTGGPAPTERGAPYGSDLRLYAAAGVPTLHLGPGDVRQAHTVGEYVAPVEIAEVAGALALTALRLPGSLRASEQ